MITGATIMRTCSLTAASPMPMPGQLVSACGIIAEYAAMMPCTSGLPPNPIEKAGPKISMAALNGR